MTNIQAGDVVVCVNTSRGLSGPGWGYATEALKVGGIYRVSELTLTPSLRRPGLRLVGFQYHGNRPTFLIERFRKVQKADDSFTDLIKRKRPAPARERAS